MARNPTKRSVIAFLVLLWSLFLNPVWAAELRASGAAAEPTLRSAFQGKFLVGVAMDGWLPKDYSPAELDLVKKQFAAITPANCMKMMHVQRSEGKFDFAMADALVAFAETNRLKVCGHCLVWAKDERTPSWFFKDEGARISREKLLERMRTHIDEVAGRYRGKVASWDVVNEALDDGDAYLRPSQWQEITGEEFILKSFEFARRADPAALLIYNDYNLESEAKRAKLLRLLDYLKANRAPIDAVGIQGHYEIDAVPEKGIEAMIAAIQARGLKVVVSELDIDAIPRARWWADGGKYRGEMATLNPYTNGCPPDILDRQADQYVRIFDIFKRHSAAINRVTFWDLHDGRSWLNHFPWERVNYPLLFDRNARPKPAFRKIIAAP